MEIKTGGMDLLESETFLAVGDGETAGHERRERLPEGSLLSASASMTSLYGPLRRTYRSRLPGLVRGREHSADSGVAQRIDYAMVRYHDWPLVPELSLPMTGDCSYNRATY